MNRPSCKDSTSHAWIGVFAARLLQHWPRAGIGWTVKFAVAHYHHLSSVDPTEAADIFIAQLILQSKLNGSTLPRLAVETAPASAASTPYRLMFRKGGFMNNRRGTFA